MRELYAPRASSVHSLDARVKVLAALAFIILVNLSPAGAWPAFILFLSFTLSIALLTRLGLRFVFKRSLLALPFVLAAFPLIFTGPAPHIPLVPGSSWIYSPGGLERFASIAARSWLSVQAAVLLAGTTRFPDLLAALRQLGLPRVFTAVISLMSRYLDVITDEASRLLRARASRSTALPGKGNRSTAPYGKGRRGGSLAWRARTTGGMAGSLLLRSLERSDRVYAAMLARGYNGEPLHSQSVPLTRREIITLILVLGLLSITWLAGMVSSG